MVELKENEGTAEMSVETSADDTMSPTIGDIGEKMDGDGGLEAKPKKKKKKKNKSKAQKKKAALARLYEEAISKSAHLVEGKSNEELLKQPREFSGYEHAFTGPLRPCYVTTQCSPKVFIDAGIEMPDYAETGTPIAENIERQSGNTKPFVHTPDEIEKMREICRIGREVIDIAGAYIKVGVTGDEIDRVLHQAVLDRKAYPSPLNYNNFPKSLCVSVNEVICHGIPDCRPLEDGDIVNLDVSVFKNGYHSDLNETYLVGNVSSEKVHLVKTAYECLKLAADEIKPGMMYRDVGGVISKHAARNGCAVVKTYCGHGVGKHFHCAPNIPHYNRNKAVGIMRPGHIFTIEPMINLGGSWSDRLWPDNWTAVTSNGNPSAQFEHTFLVTETGVEILTARPNTPLDKMVWDQAAIQR